MAARAPRPIWSGSISFGLVNVPIRLFSATSERALRFNLLHDADGARIREKRICSADGKEVPFEHTIKGFPLSRDQYVPITREELASFAPRATHTIDIEDFVELHQIDPMYYEATYYLVPEERAQKPYALLLQAMSQSNMVGIARIVLRTKQYLCAVRPLGNALVLSTMHYADELVPADRLEGLPGPKVKASDRELTMATRLIESLASRFDVSHYRDEYREKVLAFIERKAKGEKITAPEEEIPEPTSPRDLARALEASLARAHGRHAANETEERGERRHRPSQAARKASTRSSSKRGTGGRGGRRTRSKS